MHAFDERLHVVTPKSLRSLTPSLIPAEPGHEMVIDVVKNFYSIVGNFIIVMYLQERIIDVCIVKEDKVFEEATLALGRWGNVPVNLA